MQNKNNKELQTKIRHMHERVAAGAIALGLMAGSVVVSAEIRHSIKELAAHPVMAVIEHSIKESEVAHRHMRLDTTMPMEPMSGE
jgi:peptidase E